MIVLRVLAPILSDMKSEIQKCRKASERVATTSASIASGVFQKHNLPIPCRTAGDFNSLKDALEDEKVFKEVVSVVPIFLI